MSVMKVFIFLSEVTDVADRPVLGMDQSDGVTFNYLLLDQS